MPAARQQVAHGAGRERVQLSAEPLDTGRDSCRISGRVRGRFLVGKPIGRGTTYRFALARIPHCRAASHGRFAGFCFHNRPDACDCQ
jgi:hypothetical protein